MRREVAALAIILLLVFSGALVYLVLPRPSGATTSSTTTAPSSQASSTTTVVVSESHPSSVSPGGWTTYQGNDARTGLVEVSNYTSVRSDWNSSSIDGAVYAQPLFFNGAVFVASENNSVYSLDAQTGAVNWRTNLGEPVNGSELQCGDISPSGITGTPVIDPAARIIYVVTFSSLQHTLVALNTTNGDVIFRNIAQPPGFVVTAQQQRPALTLANGMVYIQYGGLAGDCGQYNGWVVGLRADGSGGMIVYKVPASREGGLWAPSGAAVDGSGNLYVTTGNGGSDTSFDYGDSVVMLSPNLSVQGYFAPTNWAQLSAQDTDLGSVGPSFVGPNLLFQVGKAGVGYLLDSNHLGGIGGEIFSQSVCRGAYGGTAYSEPYLFVPCNDGLVELQVSGSSFSTVWHASGINAGPPIVAGGVVWTVDTSSGTLHGYSVATGHQAFSFQLGAVVHFCPLSGGGGRIFVVASGRVMAFALGG